MIFTGSIFNVKILRKINDDNTHKKRTFFHKKIYGEQKVKKERNKKSWTNGQSKLKSRCLVTTKMENINRKIKQIITKITL